MTGQMLSGRDDAPTLHAAARQRIRESRAMVASSIARLIATNQGLQPAETTNDVLVNLLRCPCDLDVLIFFFRHPSALLPLDDLALRVGYNVHDVRASIEALIAAGLLRCSVKGAKSRRSNARLYGFTSGRWGAILGPFLWLASSRDGRRSLRRALTHKERH